MQMMMEQEIRDRCCPVVQITDKVIQKQGEQKKNITNQHQIMDYSIKASQD
jgi:hypothetical protein